MADRMRLAGTILWLWTAATAATSWADNLFAEGHFDAPTSAQGWLPGSGTGTFEFVPTLDLDGCPHSGSLELRDTASVPDDVFQIYRCLGPVQANLPYHRGYSIRFPEDQFGAELHLSIAFFTGPDCTGSLIVAANLAVDYRLPGLWQTHSLTSTSPSQAVSAAMILSFINGPYGVPVTIAVDDLFFNPAIDLFADDFEQAGLCRWLPRLISDFGE
jgi:hypothetical protein